MRFHAIPTNLIMGFLGAGKTTAILDLLRRKPHRERWAVLVNEFGTVGVDGAIFSAFGATVHELPGGCLCCAVGVPLQVAVNRLLREAEPDRLLIEPSGLGHPQRVIATLSTASFGEVLDLRASICLVDPKKLSDERYSRHENFVDQIALADVLVANKLDCAGPADLERFTAWALACEPAKAVVATTTQGILDPGWLDEKRRIDRKAHHPEAHAHRSRDTGDGPRDGYRSRGWIFPGGTRFDASKLRAWFTLARPERGKGLFATDRGWLLFNCSDGATTVTTIAPAEASRAELILRVAEWGVLERSLMACRTE